MSAGTGAPAPARGLHGWHRAPHSATTAPCAERSWHRGQCHTFPEASPGNISWEWQGRSATKLCLVIRTRKHTKPQVMPFVGRNFRAMCPGAMGGDLGRSCPGAVGGDLGGVSRSCGRGRTVAPGRAGSLLLPPRCLTFSLLNFSVTSLYFIELLKPSLALSE